MLAGMPRALVPKQGLSREQKSLGFLRMCASVQVSPLRVLLTLDLHPEETEPGAQGTTHHHLIPSHFEEINFISYR